MQRHFLLKAVKMKLISIVITRTSQKSYAIFTYPSTTKWIFSTLYDRTKMGKEGFLHADFCAAGQPLY